jgi:predicted nucleotidyltransferase
MIETLKNLFGGFKPRILFAYIFGSAGTESQHPRSDMDIAVYFDSGDTAIELGHKALLYADLSRATGRNDIDLVVLNTCNNQMLLYDIMVKGRLVYDIAPETRAVFEQTTLHAAIDFKEQRERTMA